MVVEEARSKRERTKRVVLVLNSAQRSRTSIPRPCIAVIAAVWPLSRQFVKVFCVIRAAPFRAIEERSHVGQAGEQSAEKLFRNRLLVSLFKCPTTGVSKPPRVRRAVRSATRSNLLLVARYCEAGGIRQTAIRIFNYNRTTERLKFVVNPSEVIGDFASSSDFNFPCSIKDFR